MIHIKEKYQYDLINHCKKCHPYNRQPVSGALQGLKPSTVKIGRRQRLLQKPLPYVSIHLSALSGGLNN